MTLKNIVDENIVDSMAPVSKNSDSSSEIKKGNLVLIQHSQSPLSLPVSSPYSLPKSYSQNISKVTEKNTTPQIKVSKRLPVVISIYRKSCKYFAVATLAGRHQMARSSPMCINLKKYNVAHCYGSNIIDLIPIGLEDLSLTFEATSASKASEWAQLFKGRNEHSTCGSLPTRFRVPGGLNLKKNSPNSLEQINEDECDSSDSLDQIDEDDSDTDNISAVGSQNIGTNWYSTNCNRYSSINQQTHTRKHFNPSTLPLPSSSSSLLSSSSLSQSHQYWNSGQISASGVSRRPSLPVLSESFEEEDEEEADEVDDMIRYRSFMGHRLD